MKIILFILAILTSLSTFGQSWSPAGATWKYTYITYFWVSGYVEIKYAGDTIINSQAANKLQKTFYGYNHSTSQYFTSPRENEFTYEQNGVVYLLFNNNWDTLYNFKASIGETWRLAKQPIMNVCDSNSTLTVLDTGSTLINGESLKFLVIQFNYNDSSSRDTIIEKIGFTGSYMFPYDNCDAALDGNEGGPFRCYEDDNFPSYKPTFSEVCEFIVGQKKIDDDLQIKIAPNPVKNELRIINNKYSTSYFIHSIEGKLIRSEPLEDTIISLVDLNTGIYILTITTNKGVTKQFKISKE